MKAIVYHEYGSPEVLELQEVDKPLVGDDEVLVRVHAASVNPADWHFMTGTPYIARAQLGLLKPKRNIAGLDVAGRVEAVGQNVTQFEPGDEVFGEAGGTYAEYVCVAEDFLVAKPANLTFEQAAAVPVAAFTALQGLRDKGQIQRGQKVLINGASGGVGTFGVQIAKALGAEVTGVCSTRNVKMVRSIGADHVIDYTEEDFTENGQRYDLILDAVGTQSLSDCKRALGQEGIYVMVGAPKSSLGILMRLFRVMWKQKMVWFVAERSKQDLAFLAELLEAGTITPVIDRSYPLSEAAEALRYQGEGHAQGKTVITV